MSSKTAKRVLACIVVRMKSVRLPRKALADIWGKPLLLRLIERLRLAQTVDEIIICTSKHPDDKILVESASQWGVEAIAGDEEDIVSRLMEASKRFAGDLVVRVTGDNPLTDPESLDRMVMQHQAADADYTRISGMPLGMSAEVLSTEMLPRLRQAIPHPSHSEYLLLYAFDPEQFACLALDPPDELNRPFYSVTVDTPPDLELVRHIFSQSKSTEAGPSASEVVSLLDNMPGYRGIAPNKPVKMPNGDTMEYSALLELLKERAASARKQWRGIQHMKRQDGISLSGARLK